jgi:exopolyphosphatase/guanosine-5'-triphosphate,3'-diphosphate pyrophosphatase
MNDAARRQEFLAFMERVESEPAHVLHVAAIALRLFDQLEPLHGRPGGDRLVLEAAGCLHDLGWSVAKDGKGHHKESARLIREYRWETWPADEIEIVAQVARYHRKAEPALEHESFAALGEAQRNRVEQLAALLRVADALDRSHTQRVTHVAAQITPEALQLTLTSARPLDAELAVLPRKARLAERLWARRLVVERLRERGPRT